MIAAASREDLIQENTSLRNELTYLKEQLEWFKRQLFGRKSEKNLDPVDQQQHQLEGFESITAAEGKTTEVPAHSRQKAKQAGGDKITLPEDIPLDLPAEQKTCPETGTPLVKIGEEVTYSSLNLKLA